MKRRSHRSSFFRKRLVVFLLALLVVLLHRTGAQPVPGPEPRHRYTNRLVREQSPYLLLHAHNPVDWYPWGEEAFSKARRENKPIFLSVGYYTCHWCHVMERESYSNPTIAELLNRWFVAVKVDREERPDIDSAYMSFVEAATGSGGWPMNVVLTPDLKPFFGGTYFPPEDRDGRAGLETLLPKIAETWRTQHDQVVHSASRITEQLQASLTPTRSPVALQPAVLDTAFLQIGQSYDSAHPGFGSAPKFPRSVVHEFLLRYWKRTGKKDALDMALNSLRAMASGGVHDQLGGGFHRYSTDTRWQVPHFEKMLYDQAQLAQAYTEAYQITHEQLFADVARDILDCTLREMRDPQGGFYSALDADSLVQRGRPESGEGAFYVWESAEIERTLGKETAQVFNFRFGVRPDGNVPPEQDIEGWLKRKNVLFQEHSIAETARQFGMDEREASDLVEQARRKLYAARAVRPRPPTDTKVITAWNGLMISALAKASQTLAEPRYLQAANRAANFLKGKLYDTASGKLKRRYRNGTSEIAAYPSDYAFLIQGLLDLYEASFDVQRILWALSLQANEDRLFWDSNGGGYFNTSTEERPILLRMRESYDGAEPSANSVAAMNLFRLWQLTGQEKWKAEADKTLIAFSQSLKDAPEAAPLMAAALDFSLAQHKQIVIAGSPDAPDTKTLLRLVWARFIPNRVLLLADGGPGQQQLARWLPLVANVTRNNGRATAYICKDYVCNRPSPDPKVVADLLDAK